ncbi:probable glutamate receptor [Panulirus ornatus]|uniref:probable glutamate receptor n=1 Tax=Panulirus ornatus TaxID=150431 RepID=UPI003A8A6019
MEIYSKPFTSYIKAKNNRRFSRLIFISGAMDVVPSAAGDARLVADYVQFYDFKQVYVIDGGSGAGRSPGSIVWNPWTLQVLSLLVTLRAPHVSVLADRKLPGLAPAAHGESRATNISGQLNQSSKSSSELVVQRILTQADQMLFLQVFQDRESELSWLLVFGGEIPSYLSRIYFPLNNKVTLATVTGEKGEAFLWVSYQVSRHLPRHTRLIGRWSPSTHHTAHGSGQLRGLENPDIRQTFHKSNTMSEDRVTHLHKTSENFLRDFYTKLKLFKLEKQVLRHGILEAPRGDLVPTRYDLTGLHLRCTTLQLEPFTILEHQSDGSVLLSGIVGDVFATLQEITNFTSRCHVAKDRSWGSMVAGRWNGMVGELVSGQADVVAAPLDITYHRSTVVDLLIGIVRDGYKMVMRRPSTSDYMWTAYTKQFQPDVWLVVVAAVVVLVAMTFVMLYFSQEQENHISIVDALSMITGFLLGQGTTMSVVGMPARVVAFICLLLNVLLLAHYTSNLITALAVGPPLPSITGLDDINRNPSLTLGYVKGSALNEYLRDSTLPTYRKAYQLIEADNFESLTEGVAEGVRRVLREPYIFLEWEVPMAFNHGQDCRLYSLPTTYFLSQASLALRKGSPLAPLFNIL